MKPTVIHADSRDALREMPDASIDACVCDPPYALVSIGKRYGADNAAATVAGVYGRSTAGFMGKKWDTGETAFDPAFWAEVLRVLKPGAHLIAFGGTRTFHRLVCAIEDSGFEVRDQLAWLFGSGFPKSHDVSKSIDRKAGAEREDKFEGSFERRAGPTGNKKCDACGKWLVSGSPCKCPRPQDEPQTDGARQWQGWGTALKPAHEPICLARKPLIGTVAANVLQHGTGALNIDVSRIETGDSLGGGAEKRVAIEGKHEGWSRPWMHDSEAVEAHASRVRANVDKAEALGRWPANVIHDGSEEVLAHFPDSDGQQGDVRGTEPSEPLGANTYGQMKGRVPAAARIDSGSAARFFYTAKADASDRLESKHPTVKPVDLMAYLIKLVTPPGGVVLDPFAGSGTTGMACMREGFECILIEREAEYVADIKRRVLHVRGEDAPLFAAAEKPVTVGELFALPADVYKVE